LGGRLQWVMMTPMAATNPDRTSCDLLVVGSGSSGLAAAVTAAWHGRKVVIAEKESVFGDATAWSGGWMWAPGNSLAQRAGIDEAPQQPLTCLRNELGDR
jgi:succinate dehydrogenase/fumarate reductase flavoprotein subunit